MWTIFYLNAMIRKTNIFCSVNVRTNRNDLVEMRVRQHSTSLSFSHRWLKISVTDFFLQIICLIWAIESTDIQHFRSCTTVNASVGNRACTECRIHKKVTEECVYFSYKHAADAMLARKVSIINRAKIREWGAFGPWLTYAYTQSVDH